MPTNKGIVHYGVATKEGHEPIVAIATTREGAIQNLGTQLVHEAKLGNGGWFNHRIMSTDLLDYMEEPVAVPPTISVKEVMEEYVAKGSFVTVTIDGVTWTLEQ